MMGTSDDDDVEDNCNALTVLFLFLVRTAQVWTLYTSCSLHDPFTLLSHNCRCNRTNRVGDRENQQSAL